MKNLKVVGGYTSSLVVLLKKDGSTETSRNPFCTSTKVAAKGKFGGNFESDVCRSSSRIHKTRSDESSSADVANLQPYNIQQ